MIGRVLALSHLNGGNNMNSCSVGQKLATFRLDQTSEHADTLCCSVLPPSLGGIGIVPSDHLAQRAHLCVDLLVLTNLLESSNTMPVCKEFEMHGWCGSSANKNYVLSSLLPPSVKPVLS